jgi:hypothetical protein
MRLQRILELPLAKQATCVLLAAEIALPVWKRWEENTGMVGLGDRFIECFHQWSNGQASDDQLEGAAQPIEAALPRALRRLEDPSAGMAGYAIHAVRMIALDQCEDVHIDIVFSSVCFAVSAACGATESDMFIGWNKLNELRLDLLEPWWEACTERVPELK